MSWKTTFTGISIILHSTDCGKNESSSSCISFLGRILESVCTDYFLITQCEWAHPVKTETDSIAYKCNENVYLYTLIHKYSQVKNYNIVRRSTVNSFIVRFHLSTIHIPRTPRSGFVYQNFIKRRVNEVCERVILTMHVYSYFKT